MNFPRKLVLQVTGVIALVTAAYIALLMRSPVPVQAQNQPPPSRPQPARVAAPADAAATPGAPSPPPAPVPGAQVQPPAGAPTQPPGAAPTGTPQATLPAEVPSVTATNAPSSADDEMQLSFQNANVDMIVQWLAKNTGKSVVKHPKVQCQLTI